MATRADPSSRPPRHPEHDDVAAELRGWFTRPIPEIGLTVSEEWYGSLSVAAGWVEPRLILTVDEEADVARALAEAQAAIGMRPLAIWVDDRARCARLDDALRAAGAAPVKATTHLALVGELHAASGPDDLVVEDVTEDRLEAWARTKMICFANSEVEPVPDALAAELAVRRPEMALARLQLASLGAEAVGVLAFYDGDDQLVFNLGTRVGHRRRGIAQELLARWAAAGVAAGCRSLVINADDPGRPRDLYRRIGFVDEVYWYQRYALAAP